MAILRSWSLVAVLAAVPWWNVLVPSRNPFDAVYNRLVAVPRSLPRLAPAPAPRRFAQGMAGTFMIAAGVSLLMGWHAAAYVVEAMPVVALSALIFGKFCLGSCIYHLLTGQAGFANRTLPWSESPRYPPFVLLTRRAGVLESSGVSQGKTGYCSMDDFIDRFFMCMASQKPVHRVHGHLDG